MMLNVHHNVVVLATICVVFHIAEQLRPWVLPKMLPAADRLM
jgi:hypothetical protein